MNDLITDVRYALRALRKAPGFTLVAVLTLALGIGANSAIFSVLSGVVLRPLPYAQPDRLVSVASKFPTLGFDEFWISPPEYLELRERSRALASLGGYRTGQVSIGGTATPMRVTSAVATHELFTTLGVAAMLGRPFNAEEDVPNGENVVTLSHDLWQRAFAGDPQIVGQSIQVNGNASRVTGVMPPGFDVADAGVEVWIPVAIDRANRQNRGSHFLNVVARRAPGVSFEQAEAEMRTLVAQWSSLNPDSHVPVPDNHPIFLTDLREKMIGGIRPALMLLLGAVAFVLLIACANVANLLLARAETRQREVAVRAAIGAGRGRLLRQFLTEGVVLAMIGGATGLALGYVGVRLLIATNPDGIPRAEGIGLDPGVVLFTFALTLVTGLLFGLAPALNLTRRAMATALRDSAGRTTAAGVRLRVRRLLVVGEVALAVILVVGSALLLRSFAELLRVDPGFRAERLLTFQIFLPGANYENPVAQNAFFERLLPNLQALPGVTAVSAMSGLPPRRDVDANDFSFEGLTATPEGPAHNVDYYQFVTRNYFETMEIPLLSGRAFSGADEAEGATTVLVNERLVRTFYSGMDPIGQRVRPSGPDVPWLTIVGVVRDVKQGGLDEETGTEVYFLYPQVGRAVGFAPRSMNVVVRTAGDPLALASAVRGEVRTLDASLPVANLASMEEVLSTSLARPRFLTLLLGIFAAVALVLAAIGTYGVMSYSVAERRKEIGIRMALGAQASSVLRMILRQGVVTAGLGIVIGLLGAFALSSMLQAMLFNISSTDATAFVVAPLTLSVVALIACYAPALRATRVDPAGVLKQD
jgi:putative ABC transport system permease protein